MDSDATDDQKVLLDASVRFIQQTCPLARVRERAYRNITYAADYRRRAGELGWFSMLVPEDLGGGNVSGNGVLDAALVAYKRGGMLQPAPFVGTSVVAYALSAAGNEEQREKVLPALISGEASASWAISPPAGHAAMEGGVTAEFRGGAYELSGCKTFVQDVDESCWLLVTAATDDGVSQFLVPPGTPAVTVVALESLDISRQFSEVRFEGAQLPSSALVGIDRESFRPRRPPVGYRSGTDGRGIRWRHGSRLRDDAPIRQGSDRVRTPDWFISSDKTLAGRHEPPARNEQGDHPGCSEEPWC